MRELLITAEQLFVKLGPPLRLCPWLAGEWRQCFAEAAILTPKQFLHHNHWTDDNFGEKKFHLTEREVGAPMGSDASLWPQTSSAVKLICRVVIQLQKWRRFKLVQSWSFWSVSSFFIILFFSIHCVWPVPNWLILQCKGLLLLSLKLLWTFKL